jgi:hypothetical protein
MGEKVMDWEEEFGFEDLEEEKRVDGKEKR